MTDDDTERRKQFLKELSRTQWDLRRLGEKLRPSTPEAIDERWRDQQARWEIEDELDREEEAAAAKRRQQESAASPAVDPPSPEPELTEATDEETRVALRTVYGNYARGAGPNLAEVVPLVQDVLKLARLKKSKEQIQDIAGETEFKGMRGLPGRRKT
jgi:hypothetical protein